MPTELPPRTHSLSGDVPPQAGLEALPEILLQESRAVLTEGGLESCEHASQHSAELTLLFFGYTSCPDVCPMHMGHIAAALRGLEAELPGAREAIDVVFVGVDPQRDTPERLRSWLDHFGPGFVGLAGDEAALQAAQRAALVPLARREPGADDGSYTVSHASYVLLYTPDDLAHLRYTLDTRTGDWLQDLRRLVREGWRPS